jgi:hypothetical protein
MPSLASGVSPAPGRLRQRRADRPTRRRQSRPLRPRSEPGSFRDPARPQRLDPNISPRPIYIILVFGWAWSGKSRHATARTDSAGPGKAGMAWHGSDGRPFWYPVIRSKLPALASASAQIWKTQPFLPHLLSSSPRHRPCAGDNTARQPEPSDRAGLSTSGSFIISSMYSSGNFLAWSIAFRAAFNDPLFFAPSGRPEPAL